eukprot:2948594-Lingulodinium_polyedra.AAC.1
MLFFEGHARGHVLSGGRGHADGGGRVQRHVVLRGSCARACSFGWGHAERHAERHVVMHAFCKRACGKHVFDQTRKLSHYGGQSFNDKQGSPE